MSSSKALDDVMSLVGLELVKESMLNIYQTVQVVKRQGTDMSDRRYSAVLTGNPGTGKTTVAR